MSRWFGYEQPVDSHPVFPWWKKGDVYGYEGKEGVGWVRERYPYAGIVDETNCWGYEPVFDVHEDGAETFAYCKGCRHRRWVHLPYATVDRPAYETWEKLSVEELMRMCDEASPMTVPEAAVGQVWCRLAEDPKKDLKSLLVEAAGDYRTWATEERPENGAWPPEGAVLIAGEGAPWCPPELIEVAIEHANPPRKRKARTQ